MIIAIDFDGTCVTHDFPKIGKDIGAIPVLKMLTDNGHQLILFTMRSDIENPESQEGEIHTKGGNYLTDAINWFKDNDIPLFGIQTNQNQLSWTKSPKAYAQLYIDDAALGCPIILNSDFHERHFVDWHEIKLRLQHLLMPPPQIAPVNFKPQSYPEPKEFLGNHKDYPTMVSNGNINGQNNELIC